jgi:predicted CxxxxCH...CXXCH cytochrome family protein
MGKRTIGAVLLLAAVALAGRTDAAGPSHAAYVKAFEGPRSCTNASCHENAAKEVAASLHYQQRAVPQFMEGWEAGKLAGMTETY